MSINEIEVRTIGAIPSHADDADLAAELFADLLDRGGFLITCSSTRRPKPKGHGAFGERSSQREGCLCADDVCRHFLH